MKHIDSAKNPTIKQVLNYIEKARDRKRDNVFVVEGIRENARALDSGYSAQWLFFPESRMTELEFKVEMGRTEALVHACGDEAFDKIAVRKGIPNVVGIYERQTQDLVDLVLPDNALVLVLEAIEKPGNLGAILRSASAAEVDAVLLADTVVDAFHPQVVRNSLGGFFDVDMVSAPSQEIVEYLSEKGIRKVVTTLEGSTPHYQTDMSGSAAIVMGAEDTGVTDIWLENADDRILIPMGGVVDSLNVSVAAAIMLFEAKRQRS
ncbi:TrmH family RNA methyltransferase [Phaeocystidibacter luteus]|uniref:RNA methyltransferase n=1 Tax=Phaeocystidibacter luteus TaxID=911197 RepID=A0A6N6RDL2_9FLAO|nr:TrmH family RNA methyltransferase [Phaeocystidibacter luteus]KAB2807316.1 RNA methyltransferase [Phaeocystidibacter luteus]